MIFMEKEVEKFIDKICDVKEEVLGHLKTAIDCAKIDPENFDVKEAGDLSDIVKDLAETEEKCIKSCYYKELTKALKEKDWEALEPDEMEEKYGYDNWRYSSGRFAPKGKGHYAGWTPNNIHIPRMPHVYDPGVTINHGYNGDYDYMDMNYGYSSTGSNRSGGGNNSGRSNGSSGSSSNGRGGNSGSSNGSYGFHDPMDDIYFNNEHGMAYNEYKNAKRHYTQTGSSEHMRDMNNKIGNNISNIIMELKEMSEDASPEMRKRLKTEITSVLEDISKM